MIADIATFLEVGLEEQADDDRLCHVAIGGGPSNEPVRVERIRADLHGIEIECDAIGIAECVQRFMRPVDGCLTAELGGEMLLVVHAFRRQVGVELIGTPLHRDLQLSADIGDRLVEPRLAQIAPRADDVGDDIDADGLHDVGRLSCWIKLRDRPVSSGFQCVTKREPSLYCTFSSHQAGNW